MHIWWFRDGRAGHERQARALIDALARLRAVTLFEAAPLGFGALLRAAAGRLHPGEAAPDLVVGAGHDTHASLLAARRARGGRAVVLMRPSLPVAWFDLCIAPRHDRAGHRDNVLETLGPLSPVRPAGSRGDTNLVLVGGPSPHYAWSDAAVIAGIGRAMAGRPGATWRVATSRRTPADFLSRARRELPGAVTFHPVSETPPGWLDTELPRAGACLVTPDSLSMIFDALSAGVPCAVLELPASPGSRVAGAVEALLAEGRVAPAGAGEPPAAEPLAEADRAARRIVEWWFP